MKGEIKMAENKMINCKSCGAEIAKNAKSCPKCGSKNKKPFYTKIWFWVLIFFVMIGVFSDTSGDEVAKENSVGSQTEQSSSQTDTADDPEISYTPCSVDDMMSLLDKNALKAQKTYDDMYVEVTGRLAVVDSSGSYISLLPQYDQFTIVGVQCFIQNDEQLDIVSNLEVGDTVIVQGQITNVGEIMGYTLNIDCFV